MRARISAATAATVALAAAAFLILAAPSQAKPRGPAVTEFKQANPCPANGKLKGSCPGYVVANATPLCADDASPLQWQTLAEAKESGSWERQYCQFRRVRARS